MLTDTIIDNILTGVDSNITDEVKKRLSKNIKDMTKELENTKMNRSSNRIIGTNRDGTNGNKPIQRSDSELYTTISDMINGDNKTVNDFSVMLDSLHAKNKKYFSIIKDYEIMPILIPQINRVLEFLVNECISPDIQNDKTFEIKYLGSDAESRIQEDIDAIKQEMKLDPLLKKVYMNRYKLGREYYLVLDYTKTFDHMLEMMDKKSLNESTAKMGDIDYIDNQYGFLSETINDFNCTLNDVITIRNGNNQDTTTPIIESVNIDIAFKDLNIVVERSAISKYMKEAHDVVISESYSAYSMKNMMSGSFIGKLNEAITDTSKLHDIVDVMKKKKLKRCMIERLDPSKVFKLKVGGKVIGYFYVEDILNSNTNVVNFAQSLKDQLLKSRATNITSAYNNAEKVISKNLAERIINAFDPNIGISRIEDIDLMHDYVLNNEIYKGNKRVTFYYADEIYDLSRTDESLLTNAVFFTKLYATLLLNNIMTKVLRGRGRQIHTVRMGASPAVQRYIQNAMASLTMPEANLGTLHGSFEQLLNPFNAASDIVIPTEDDNERYITTDYIPGQDVDMNDDFLRMLLNSIVTSFGLDAAVIDATNGNLQFARTLSMESLQICNAVKSEQNELHDTWEEMCLAILRIMGNDDTINAVNNGLVKVSFFAPRSLIIQNTIDDLNNSKGLAEAIAEIIPEFNADEIDQTKRNKFVYMMVKERTNLDWKYVEDILRECGIDAMGEELENEIRANIKELKDNTQESNYQDVDNDGVVDDMETEDEDMNY